MRHRRVCGYGPMRARAEGVDARVRVIERVREEEVSVGDCWSSRLIEKRPVCPEVCPETRKLKKSLQNMYTRNFLCGILSSNAFASVSDRVCALLRNVLENY
eukprot:COSAG01_NODE_459_length_16728_cov_50.324794_11_plen_102_part_00